MDPKDLIDGGFFKRDDLYREAPEVPADPDGESFGRYRLLDVLGQGGSSTVFRARDLLLNRDVALKKLKLENGSIASRFLREAELLANLHHSSIVPVFDLGKVGESVYFTMPLIRGSTLQDVIMTRRPAAQEAARIIKEVAEAVHYAHEHGIIHRDIKPSNIMIDGTGRVLVTDFGLGRREGEPAEKRQTATGAFMGTLYYMSPEQARGDWPRVDARSDVYSLGAALYETLTGRPPFDGDSAFEILRKISQDDPRLPGRVVPGTPWEVEVVCLRALEKEPERRYPSMKEFAEDLGRYLRGEPVLARRAGFFYRLRKRAVRNRIALAVAAAGILAVATTWTLIQFNAGREIDGLVLKILEGAGESVGSFETRQAMQLHDMTKERAELARKEDSLRDFLEKYPGASQVLVSVARIRRLRGDAKGALAAVDEAIRKRGPSATGEDYLERALVRAALWQNELASAGLLPGDERGARLAACRPLIDGARQDIEDARRCGLPPMKEGWDAYHEAFIKYAGSRFAESREVCRGIIDRPGIDPLIVAEAWELSANSRIREGDYAGAADDFARACQGKPSDQDPYVGAALARVHQAQLGAGLDAEGRAAILSKALVEAGSALTIDGDHAPALYVKGWLLCQQGDLSAEAGRDPAPEFMRAIEALDRAVGLTPENIIALNMRGLVHRTRARLLSGRGERPLAEFDQAIADFSRCVELNPRYANGFGNRGMVRVDRSRLLADKAEVARELDAAIEDCTKAIDLGGTKAAYFTNRAAAYFHKAERCVKEGIDPSNLVDLALGDYDHLVNENPLGERALLNRGNVHALVASYRLAQGGDPLPGWALAGEDYNAALAINGRYEEALVNRGTIHLQRFIHLTPKGIAAGIDLENALDFFSRAIEVNGNNAVALGHRGMILSGRKQWKSAAADLEKALRINPDLGARFREALAECRNEMAAEGY